MISSAQNTQVKNIIKLNQKAKACCVFGLFFVVGSFRLTFGCAPVAEMILDTSTIESSSKHEIAPLFCVLTTIWIFLFA